MPTRHNNTRRSAQHSAQLSTQHSRRHSAQHSRRHSAQSSAQKSPQISKQSAAQNSAHIVKVNTTRFSKRLNKEATEDQQMQIDARAEEKAIKQKAKNKAKADKKFDKLYGGGSADSGGFGGSVLRVLGVKKPNAGAGGESESGGPRAALYKGEKVAPQKVAKNFTLKFSRPLFAIAIIAFVCFMLYTPAQQYYLQMRETSRLQAEYVAVSQRSSTLLSDIKRLETDEGIEDRAHQDLGYIKRGEATASIKGLDFSHREELQSNVPPGSVPAPETWYSPVLDFIFGY